MSRSKPSLLGRHTKRWEAILSQFESVWQNGEVPNLDDFLKQEDETEFRRLLLLADLEYRIKQSANFRIEFYFERYPDLKNESTVVLELVAAEFKWRNAMDSKVSPDEYYHRFPQLQSHLENSPLLPTIVGSELEAAIMLVQTPSQFPQVDGYEIIEILGRGGMGIVFKALHKDLQRPVALKMILPGGHGDAELLARFRAKAQALARLQHPNIVQVYDIGSYQNLPFLALELCSGGTLAERLKDTQMTPEGAAELIAILARAVQVAHDGQIIHRDLKPANILFTADGTLKISDFGLAKVLDLSLVHTVSGAVMGTPSYMAPEQALGQNNKISHATDVYALGAILYECLTGHRPFQGNSIADVLLQVVEKQPTLPRQWQPAIPEELESICLRCLQKDSTRRFPSALDLAEHLQRYQQQSQKTAADFVPPTNQSQPKKRNRLQSASSLLRHPTARCCLIGVICALVSWSALGLPIVAGLQEWLYDAAFTLRGNRSTDAKVIIIGIDDKSLASLRKPMLFISPELASVIDYLHSHKASAIGLDLLIAEEYRERKEFAKDKEGDATKLYESINKAGNVIVAEAKQNNGWLQPMLQWRQLNALLNKDNRDLGFINLAGEQDHYVRRQQLLLRDDNAKHTQFALALYAQANHLPVTWEPKPFRLRVGEKPIPLDQERRLRINYVGPPGTFPIVSMHDVLQAARQQKPLDHKVTGAIVIIGVTARSQQDYHPTPYSNAYTQLLGGEPASLMSGSEIQANIIATMSDRAFIQSTPSYVSLLLLVGCTSLLGWFFLRLKLVWGLILMLCYLLAVTVLFVLAFSQFHLRVPVLPFLLVGVATYSITFVLRWSILRQMLGVVKSESIARLLEANPFHLNPHGEERILSVLYCEIQNFSAYVRNHSPNEVVTLLNAYFREIVPVIEQHGGTINNYHSDGVQVYFNAPTPCSEHAPRAVRTAMALVACVHARQKQWADLDFPDLRIGIGIDTGRVIAGTVGSPRRLDYAAIGAAPDNAIRIATENQHFDSEVLISSETWHDLPGKERRLLGSDESEPVTIKGKHGEKDVYRIGH